MDDEEKKGNDEIASQYVVGKMESSQYRASYNAKRDRAKYDDTAKRKKFRDEQFGNKQTIVDPYTGETLHKSTSAAKNKYGDKRANYHTAQTDHTIPLETVYNGLRNNPFLSDEKIKEIANDYRNYKEINGHLNQSKGSKSNIKTARKDPNMQTNTKVKMVKAEIKAGTRVLETSVLGTLEGANKVGIEAGIEGAKIGAAISIAQNATSLVKGEEDAGEFVYNVSTDIAKSGVTTYQMAILNKSVEWVTTEAADQIAKQTSKTALEKTGEKVRTKLLDIKNADALGRIVNATMEVGKSVKGYLDGELDEAELADDLSEKGSGMATALLAETIAKQTALGTVIEAGGLAGGIVGVVVSTVGYMVGTAVYNQVKKRAIKIAEIDENIEKFNRMADQVLEYRQQLEKNLKELEIKNTETIMNSFKKMEQSIFDNDVNTFTNSLNDICEIFGKKVKFKSNKEFLDFWNDPNMVLEI